MKALSGPHHAQVSRQVGHSTKAKEDAFYHVERLILQLLGLLCSRPTPHSVLEIQERIQKMFPPPVDKWAIDEATNALNKQGKKRNTELVFPVDKIHSLLQKVRKSSINLFISASEILLLNNRKFSSTKLTTT